MAGSGGRNNKGKVKAEGSGGGGGSVGKSSGGSVLRSSSGGEGSGKSLAQLQAERMAEGMFTDMMASAGVGGAEMRQELMQWIPKEFARAYVAMVTQALHDSDGGANGRGQGDKAKGELGKAAGGGSGGGAKRRGYKKYWTVQDEQMLELKDKVDKRLRSMARQIWEEVEARETSE